MEVDANTEANVVDDTNEGPCNEEASPEFVAEAVVNLKSNDNCNITEKNDNSENLGTNAILEPEIQENEHSKPFSSPIENEFVNGDRNEDTESPMETEDPVIEQNSNNAVKEVKSEEPDTEPKFNNPILEPKTDDHITEPDFENQHTQPELKPENPELEMKPDDPVLELKPDIAVVEEAKSEEIESAEGSASSPMPAGETEIVDDSISTEQEQKEQHSEESVKAENEEPVENSTTNSLQQQEEQTITPLENLVEPISPANGELSSENEEDFEEEDDEDVGKINKDPMVQEERKVYNKSSPVITIQPMRSMLEDIEEGELDYDEDGEVPDELEDLPDLPEYDPSIHKKENGGDAASEEGEIVSDGDKDNEEREEGEIRDDDETGQVYICVDAKSDKWKKVSREEQKKLQELEEGQIEEDDSPIVETPALPANPGRFIPRTLCKYYNNGLCRWGSTCRFLHPGVNDKGIPTDVQPTWNATAGNYVMHRPPGMYPNAFGKAPPPMECINVPIMPSPVVVDMAAIAAHHPGEMIAVPISMMGAVRPDVSKPESAWERGLRRAKEVKEAAARRREEDTDFERKRLNMRIPESVVEKAVEYDAQPDISDRTPPPYNNYKTYNEWEMRERDGKPPPRNDAYHFDRRTLRPENETRRYNQDRPERSDRLERPDRPDRPDRPERPDRYQPPKDVDRSSGRARLAELPPSHPIRREERQRQREREKRREEKEKRDKDKVPGVHSSSKSGRHDEKENIVDPHRQEAVVDPLSKLPPPAKSTSATEWHDPWMRTQAGPVPVQKDPLKQSGIEAVSDSSSSDSDSDSDSDSSSSSKSSGSDSDSGSSSSDGEKTKAKAAAAAAAAGGGTAPAATTENRSPPISRKKRDRHHRLPQPPPPEEKLEGKERTDKSEPLSYEEWKRLQNLQKAQQQQQQQHQHVSSQYKSNPPPPSDRKEISGGGVDKYNRDMHRSSSSSRYNNNNSKPDEKRPGPPHDPRRDGGGFPVGGISSKRTHHQSKPESSVVSGKSSAVPKNDDKFDSPKRKSDSNSGSDSDSDSDSDSESSDSSDSDTDSGSDADEKARAANAKAAADPAAKALIPVAKPVPARSVSPTIAAGGKRPARKDDLLKELKAVEDAIARKRAKID